MLNFLSLTILLLFISNVGADSSLIHPYVIDTHVRVLGLTVEELPIEYRKHLKIVRVPDHDPETFKWAARYDVDIDNRFHFKINSSRILLSASFFNNPNFHTSRGVKTGDTYCQVLNKYPNLGSRSFSGRYGVQVYVSEEFDRIEFIFEIDGFDSHKLGKLMNGELKGVDKEICNLPLMAISIHR